LICIILGLGLSSETGGGLAASVPLVLLEPADAGSPLLFLPGLTLGLTTTSRLKIVYYVVSFQHRFCKSCFYVGFIGGKLWFTSTLGLE
jgi:hypothetical protein